MPSADAPVPAPGRPLVIAHRGASGYRPEHTEAAYRLAFALGADAVEPDLVATRDGVLVVRHENEISGTTDVADRPEFADRRRTREIDGVRQTGWFTEDFTWAELATLRARERLAAIRPLSATFDGRYPLIRFREVLRLAADAMQAGGRAIRVVAELKHATHFAALGLPLDELLVAELDEAGWGDAGRDRLAVESFEPTVLDRLRARGAAGARVLLLEDGGRPWDLVASAGAAAPDYDAFLAGDALAALAGRVDGISVGKARLLGGPGASVGEPDDAGGAALVEAAHAAGLEVFTWTLRPENGFLAPRFRSGAADAAYGDWPAEFAAVLATGVDGVFADHPDLAVEARGAAA